MSDGKTELEVAEYDRTRQTTGGSPAHKSDLVTIEKDPIGPKRRICLFFGKKGFQLSEDEWADGQAVMVLKRGWDKAFLRVLQKKGVRALRFSDSMGWMDPDVKFLENIPASVVSGIDIYSHRISDVSALKKFRS